MIRRCHEAAQGCPKANHTGTSRRRNENLFVWAGSPTYPSPGSIRASPLLGAGNNESMHANRRCYTQERNGFNGKPHNRMEDLGVILTIRQHQWTSIHLSLHKFIKLILKKISEGIEIKEDALIVVEEDT